MQEHTFSFTQIEGGFEVDINPKDLPGLEVKATGATWQAALREAEGVLHRAMFRAHEEAAAHQVSHRGPARPHRPKAQPARQASL
jgi:hypothetical protein